MFINLNGTTTDTAATTVAQLVDQLTDSHPDGVAVAVDGAVVPRSQWDTTIQPGAQVDVLGAVQGG
ncbi:hypothetical protein CPHO_04715 [Corynebacterium phocae]|uniref:Thiamine biosynthesis protein ThiS n=1 Tax=Corynebacterium phocae TaxID=161895 RepID=A0A1L7D2I0_9CORY|nr:sulfur carrier protein ThiS [Corynebacterium phocae]APT92305.1 hypothetical protein CPHO_04715 [Corynebacterium phocae]KAA8725340.1 sulfur carrier protein ThiS [Corynebacterium phocae]